MTATYTSASKELLVQDTRLMWQGESWLVISQDLIYTLVNADVMTNLLQIMATILQTH